MDIIVFNVGGRIFSTTRATIERVSDCYLEIAVSKRWGESTGSEQTDLDSQMKSKEVKPIFIDRDPKHFEKILNWHRYGEEGEDFPLPKAVCELKEIKQEAEFYGLSELRDLVDKQIAQEEEEEAKYQKALGQIKGQLDNIMGSLDEIYFRAFSENKGRKK